MLEDRKMEFDRRSSWRQNKEWQARRLRLEDEKREAFISQECPEEIRAKLFRVLKDQPWHTAKSSPHQYVLLYKFTPMEGLDWDELMDIIAKYGFYDNSTRWGWNQYFRAGDFFYWGNSQPRIDGKGICMLLNRRRVDNPPMSAYNCNFSGKWETVGEVRMGYPQSDKKKIEKETISEYMA